MNEIVKYTLNLKITINHIVLKKPKIIPSKIYIMTACVVEFLFKNTFFQRLLI